MEQLSPSRKGLKPIALYWTTGCNRIYFMESSRDQLDGNNTAVMTVTCYEVYPSPPRFGDYGLYTGQVNDEGRPDGKRSTKYDNGVFYEGT
eukprot:scaffold48694_cov56-Cyclotella_meneghiniana.AAC.2